MKTKNKKDLRLIIVLSIIIIAILIIAVFITSLPQFKHKPDIASEKIIRELAARQINKDPNDLNDTDFAQITRLSLMRENNYQFPTLPFKIELLDIEMLDKFSNLQILNVPDIIIPDKEIPGWMKFLAKYGIVDLSEKYKIDLSPLSNLHDLQSLTLNCSRINDIEAISEHVKLIELLLDQTNVSDLTPVQKLKKLQALSIEGTKVTDLEPIKNLTNLQELYLSKTNISNLEPLKYLTNLNRLEIQDCPNITDKQIEDLQKALPELQILT